MVKRLLIVALKNAVNASILSLGVVYHNPAQYNFTTIFGMWNIAKFIVIPAVLSREGIVWIPQLLKWSSTDEPVEAPAIMFESPNRITPWPEMEDKK